MPIEGVGAAQAGLDALLSRISEGARKGAQDAGFIVEAAAKRRASGRPGPDVITGTLRRSITTSPVVETGPGRWSVEVSPHVVYGRIQELGGTITAKNGPYLIFQVQGSWVMKRSVTLPSRAYMHPAAIESRPAALAAVVVRLRATVG